MSKEELNNKIYELETQLRMSRACCEELRDEMKAIALALGRSKTDGESDCDWHDLTGDVTGMMDVLKDIYRITCMTSKASHKEQTEIFQRMRRIIGAGAESV